MPPSTSCKLLRASTNYPMSAMALQQGERHFYTITSPQNDRLNSCVWQAWKENPYRPNWNVNCSMPVQIRVCGIVGTADKIPPNTFRTLFYFLIAFYYIYQVHQVYADSVPGPGQKPKNIWVNPSNGTNGIAYITRTYHCITVHICYVTYCKLLNYKAHLSLSSWNLSR